MTDMITTEDMDAVAPHCSCGKRFRCGALGATPIFICIECSVIGVASQDAIDMIIEQATLRAASRSKEHE